MSKSKFPNPHEVETIPGTEGWERMYPEHYRFTPEYKERAEYEQNNFWFQDALHYPVPLHPFDLIWDECWYLSLSQYCSSYFCFPPINGIDHRIVNGNVYIAENPIKDPNDIPARVPEFEARAGFYFQNWADLEQKWVKKMEGIIGELESIDFGPLPVLEDMSVINEAKGTSSGYELLKKYDTLIDLGVKCWQYHFEFLNLGYGAYVQFVDFCNKAFPDITLQTISQMIGGVEVIMYRPDEELKNLAKLAVKLKVDKELSGQDNIETVISKLEKSDNGKKWIEAWDNTKQPWFNISSGTGWYHNDPSWNDDLNIPLDSMRIYLEKLQKGESIERPLEQVKAESERITAEYRDLLKTDEDKKTFDEMHGLSKNVFPYVENHLFYVEHWFHSVFWNKMRDVAAIMKNAGILNDIEDVWLMNRHEIKQSLWDLVCAWATVVKPYGVYKWPEELKWRKGVMEKFMEWEAPEALGTPPEVVQNPFMIVLWGVTNESIGNWLKLRDMGDPSKMNEFNGFAASPGIVEGVARVCKTVKEINTIKDGEILVSPTTSPSWAPAFQKIKACVTDVGGIMSHAAIVCREYGMPAVVGTGKASKVIKTGTKIRVNGDTGIVEIV